MRQVVPPNVMFSMMDVLSPPLQHPVHNSFEINQCDG